MDGFRIEATKERIASTIRFRQDYYDRLMVTELSIQRFLLPSNQLVNQCVAFALEHLEEAKEFPHG